ncbi:hypothetical protein [uncultured Sneathia sp.]|uniref:hypothetical protein n=1 Tax=uncultured Sneathia sp. TaxID=278067 RepID=UPI00259AD2BC|nr:hypothetical protein [uncultured Sneathia sp.]
MYEFYINYGVLGILGFMFLKHNAKILKDREDSYNQNQKEIVETLVLIKEQLLKGNLKDSVFIDVAKVKTNEVFLSYIHTTINYFIRNNLKENKENIKVELTDKTNRKINDSYLFFKNKISINDNKQLKNVLSKYLLECNKIVFKTLDSVVLTECRDYKHIIRVLETDLKKIHNDCILEIEQIK